MVVGLVGMLLGAIDPLEGCFVVLPSAGLIALSTWLVSSRWRPLATWAVALVAFGVAAMVVLSMLGGIGGNSGLSIWWGLLILPYPIGWLMGLASAILLIVESCQCHRGTAEAAQ
jgi:hypothetical protein